MAWDDNHLKISGGDVAHTIMKVGISAIPFIGGPANELFSAIITPPLSKRRDEWINSIATGLRELEVKIDGFSLEGLSENEVFITTVLHASQAAIILKYFPIASVNLPCNYNCEQ